MAQQTQVARAAAAWRPFIDRFPAPSVLADAPPAEAIRAWAGLGYNRRAINLRRAAAMIVERHHGRVPDAIDDLEALPGVGAYTARAVASIAFGRPVAAVDTNVRRVVGRIVAGDPAALTDRALQAAADALVPPDRAADWTHALMDVGATLCRPRRPSCAACPAAGWCRFAARPGASAEAGSPRPGRTAVPSAVPPASAFEATSRWLRGRVVESLRAASPGAWQRFDQPIGSHSRRAVAIAIERLAADGLVERHPLDPWLARLPPV